MKSYISPSVTLPEITVRACVLATLLTIVLMAANMYLALKVGMTFATTLPAAVISMAVLSKFKGSNILENTVVQTFASTGGTLSAIVFALPALIIVGTWTELPYWQTTLIAVLGGLLGVLFTIPLRRALIVESENSLPFPEGQAAAEVLKVGERIKKNDNTDGVKLETGIRFIASGALVSAVLSILISGFKVAAGSIGVATKVGSAVIGASFGYGLALVGAGYLIGVRIVICMLAGSVFAYFILTPYFSLNAIYQGLSPSEVLDQIYAANIRYIGVGCIAVAALWSVINLIKPLVLGVKKSIEDHQKYQRTGEGVLVRTEKDLPIKYLSSMTLVISLPLIALVAYFIGTQDFDISVGKLISLILICIFLVLITGFLLAAVAGYMAGIIGSSNSPISGLVYLAAIAIAFILAYVAGAFFGHDIKHIVTQKFLIGLILFITSIILAVVCIANDNLQDLKTGQVVGATPWKQQVALMMGVVAAAVIIAPVFNLLYNAYGLVGAPFPHPGMKVSEALTSPQANLAAALVQGIVSHKMNWSMLLFGGLVGIVLILVDQMVFKPMKWPRISLFSFAIAIYLPMAMILPIVLGGFISYFAHKSLRKRAENKKDFEKSKTAGVLVASGMIVGEALMSIFSAGMIAYTGSQDALALVGPSFAPTANILGIIFFVISILILYRYKIAKINQ
ncbi:oligopeptide transporter, OPT family [Thiotrichales bacterium 19S9-12]|nr:oligopeptide transporter, OPT family [Thiotrichales bacterium 19S9-11]MCF6812460.1 oligopeptide transporter, OPT family [Thiotrichales bacterium 19S9-12]